MASRLSLRLLRRRVPDFFCSGPVWQRLRACRAGLGRIHLAHVTPAIGHRSDNVGGCWLSDLQTPKLYPRFARKTNTCSSVLEFNFQESRRPSLNFEQFEGMFELKLRIRHPAECRIRKPGGAQLHKAHRSIWHTDSHSGIWIQL
jgi:hypothetical protein